VEWNSAGSWKKRCHRLGGVGNRHDDCQSYSSSNFIQLLLVLRFVDSRASRFPVQDVNYCELTVGSSSNSECWIRDLKYVRLRWRNFRIGRSMICCAKSFFLCFYANNIA
jgi:hypothetical protein